MKKSILSVFILLSLVASVFSASYTNNPYQKLADEYNKKAEVAFDSGEYDLAVEYSILAEENSKLSEQYVNTMMQRLMQLSKLNMHKINLLGLKKFTEMFIIQ